MSPDLEPWTMFLSESLLSAYRRTGADLPFGDLRGHHGVPMEGYFWRLTDAGSGTVLVAFTGVSRDAGGASWATVGLAAHPGGFVRTAVAGHAAGDPRRLGVDAGGMLRADEHGLEVDLGPGARVRVAFEQPVGWPRRALGGVGVGHLVPGLGQYWHPHMLDARVRGTAEIDGRTLGLGTARAYAEKNWTPWAHGFPSEWWWGQAGAFGDDEVCVAFAGGRLHGFGAGAVVVRLGGELLHAVGPPAPLRMRLGDGSWRLQARTLRDVVTVEGSADDAPYRLPVPKPRERRAAPEVSAMHLAGRLHLRVRRGRRLRYEGTSALAGLEQGREG
jgi:hypothetical protein